MTNVAVVAVHGVADQKPGESARSIASLLATTQGYGPFVETSLRIAMQPMKPGAEPPRRAFGLHYMFKQLVKYDPRPGTYDTVRLDGTRQSDGTEVHVHEVYWADLSRAGETWYRLLAEFYQLILHLPSLGRNGLREAQKAHNDAGPWVAARWLQEAAVWLLTVPAALLNVVLLSIGFVALSAEVPPGMQAPAATAIVALLAGVVGFLALRKVPLPPWLFYLMPVAYLAAIAFFWRWVQGAQLYKLLAVLGALAAFGFCVAVAWKYQPMKKSALAFGGLVSLLTTLLALRFVASFSNTEIGIYRAAIHTAQRVHFLLVITWVAIFAVGTLAALAGIVAAITTAKGKRADAYRATWTARFSFGFPTALFVIFTLAIWLLVVRGIGAMAPESVVRRFEPIERSVTYEPLQTAMRTMLLESSEGLEVFVGALAVFVIAALWAAGPSVLAEIKHPTNTDIGARKLGKWLSTGIRLVAGAAEIFTVAVIMMLLIGLQVLPSTFTPDQVAALLGATAVIVGAILAGKYFTKTFRAAVDILLDVDNYMRESPAAQTPRARIVERFDSLLRHLDTGFYQHIVIIAHSQGTVISADALRYLKNSANLPATPIRLFTMGSPLRQLYAKIFPYLYDWILTPAAAQALAPHQIADAGPAPAQLGVEVWSNVYCSGDYVGRELWLDDTFPTLYERPVGAPGDPAIADDANPAVRRQYCAGAGAHTHYWDANGGRDVVWGLDQLI